MFGASFLTGTTTEIWQLAAAHPNPARPISRNFSRRRARSTPPSRPGQFSPKRHRMPWKPCAWSGRDCGGRRPRVRAPHWSITSSFLQVLGGQLQRLGGVLGGVAGAPQDRGAAFGADHRIDGMLQHQHGIARGQGDGPARPALADDRRHQRHADVEAGLDGAGDGFGLAARLGFDAGIGAGGVDQGQHRHAEMVRPFPSAAAPCGSPRAWPCRNCALERLSVSLPFSLPITITDAPRKRPNPPTMARSSPKQRSPAKGVKSVDQGARYSPRHGAGRDGGPLAFSATA